VVEISENRIGVACHVPDWPAERLMEISAIYAKNIRYFQEIGVGVTIDVKFYRIVKRKEKGKNYLSFSDSEQRILESAIKSVVKDEKLSMTIKFSFSDFYDYGD